MSQKVSRKSGMNEEKEKVHGLISDNLNFHIYIYFHIYCEKSYL